MSYEIPQELEYKEKIVFGLTIKQVGIVLSFFTAGFLFYTKTHHSNTVKIGVFIILGLICLAVLYLDLWNKIKDFFLFLRNNEIRFGTFKMERFLGLKDIDNDLIITNDKKIAVLKVFPINFSIKPEAEKDAIMQTFRKFLNSIDFPIQILMNTHEIKIGEYLDKIQEKVDASFLENYKDYKTNIMDILEKNSVLDRSFYILIPETSDIEIQTKVCQESLYALRLKTTRLKNQELKDVLAKYFEGDFEGDTISYISPDKLKSFTDHIRINEGDTKIYSRIISAVGYPRLVEAGFLDKLVSSIGNFDISIHITPYSIETMMINVNKQLQKQMTDLYSTNQKGQINPILEIQAKDTRQILEELQKGQDKLFHISFYINCKSKTLKDLNFVTKKVESKLNSIMIIPKVKNFKQLDALKSVSPLCDDRLEIKRTMPTTGLSAFFPFTSPFFQLDDRGVWFGLNKNNIPVIRDIFALSNPNGVILAQSGGGKSFLSKLLIARHLINGTKVIVVDPQGEYRALVNQFNGQLIQLSRNSKTIINPLDLLGHEYGEKRLFLMDLLEVMFKDMTDPQKAMMDKAISKAYFSYGIDENQKTWNNEPPKLSDVLYELKRMEKSASAQEKMSIQSLINRVNMYVDGVFSFLNKKTDLDIKNNFVCFDISSLPNQVKPVLMYLVLDYIFMQMRKDKSRKLLVVDEAWSLLSRTQDASYLMEIVKTCRKFNLGLLLLNQEVEGLLSSKAGKSILANSSYTILMKQKPAVIKDVVKTFNLSDDEKNILLSSNVGEGILIIEDEHTELKVVASQKEYSIITTKADDSVVKEEPVKIETKKEEKVRKLDFDKLIYETGELNNSEIEFLKSKGYVKESFMDFYKNENSCIIKKIKNESISHIFLINQIKKYFQSKDLKFEEFKTLKPDIVLLLNDGTKIAFEIETGSMLKNKIKAFQEKVKTIKESYDDYFFVLTNRNNRPKYELYGKVLTKRNFIFEIERYLRLKVALNTIEN